MENTIEQAKRVLHNSKAENIYFRKTENNLISNFITSDKLILHITGTPGTGKTCTVLNATKNHKITYLNYFHNVKIGLALKKLLSSKEMIIVIDEFDKYLSHKNKECLKYLDLMRKAGIKIITISNDTKFGNIKFSPYTKEEMINIIKNKLKSEINDLVINDNALEFICKKFEKSGDLRLVQKFFLTILSKKNCQLPIKLEDLINKENETEEKNLQHLIIKNMVKEEIITYQEYLARCEDKHIPNLSKLEFNTILEYYKLE